MNAYDFQSPGPNAPFYWLEDTLDNISLETKKKLLMGIPFYGYDNHEPLVGSSFLSFLNQIPNKKTRLQWDSSAHVSWLLCFIYL
jgi:spore germination protein YaaH